MDNLCSFNGISLIALSRSNFKEYELILIQERVFLIFLMKYAS